MFFVYFARLLFDPLLLNLVVRSFAREEAEGGFWRAFILNAMVFGAGVGLSTVMADYNPQHGMWVQLGVLYLLAHILVVKLYKIGAGRALPVVICYTLFLFGASFGINYVMKGSTNFPEVVHTQFPSVSEIHDSLDLDYLMEGHAQEPK